ncbi:Amino acid/polyamine transporter I [Phaffia rhodozyma]|uniref:Amino acid/polyamine transporter I n=1 Tax=Phaffia rhodozyma TaxID=264483 RepID=A0A0F7SPD4_PHARH|nr:Amino acid/polyamine transporter I [Phaffia rhodozyma]
MPGAHMVSPEAHDWSRPPGVSSNVNIDGNSRNSNPVVPSRSRQTSNALSVDTQTGSEGLRSDLSVSHELDFVDDGFEIEEDNTIEEEEEEEEMNSLGDIDFVRRRAIKAGKERAIGWDAKDGEESVGSKRMSRIREDANLDSSFLPPSFERSEFETIVRRLKTQTQPGSLKRKKVGGALNTEDVGLDDDWEFAGWGSVAYIPLSPSAVLQAEQKVLSRLDTNNLLGQFKATSVAGNAVFGSVFYSLPALCQTGKVLSPLSMMIACLILLLWRGIMVELGGAMRINGGNYAYLLSVSGKTMGLVGAAVTLLDVVATGTVSAGTAAAYINGEAKNLPFKEYLIGILILIVFTALLLAGVKDSTKLTLSICLFHLFTMALLMVVSTVAWIREGNTTLLSNWNLSVKSWDGGNGAVRAVFNGICIGFLGVTGVECLPTFIEQIKPGVYSKALRNLLYGALLLNVPLLIMLHALVPLPSLLSASNVLALLASISTSGGGGRWLSIFVVVDAVAVLCGGVLCGGVACCALVEELSKDNVLPESWGRRWERTQANWVGAIMYFGLCLAFYATAGFSLTTLSNIFSISFEFMMLLFALSHLLLRITLPNLPIPAPFCRSRFSVTLLVHALIFTILIGNALLNPLPLGLFAAYAVGIFSVLWTAEIGFGSILRAIVWAVDQSEGTMIPRGSGWMSIGFGRKLKENKDGDVPMETKTSKLGDREPEEMEEGGKGTGGKEKGLRVALRKSLIKGVRRSKRKVMVAWIKEDEISALIQVVLYVLANEQTSHLILIHAYNSVRDIPSELQANSKLLDEAFPALTIDLKFVQGSFNPIIVQAVSDTLEIPHSRHIIGCPSPSQGDLGSFGGVRVATFRK